MKHALFGAIVALSAASCAMAAPTSALTFTSAISNSTCCNSTRGYSFSVTQDGLMATHLGVYDFDADGLNESHEVGLWTSSGTLIASAVVGAGTSGLLQDSFRYVDIADAALAVGDYVVGAYFLAGSADAQARSLAGLSTASGISYGQYRFVNNVSSLTIPLSTVNNLSGLPGGSLMVDYASVSAVPEPASWALAMAGLAGVALRLRRRA